jgi:cell division protein FtsW
LIIGIMASAARHEPEAVAALRAGREDRMNRLLRLPLPEPYVPNRTEALRDRLRKRPEAKPAKAARKPAPAKKRKPHPADRQVQRSGHHGGRTGTGRRARAMEGQR